MPLVILLWDVQEPMKRELYRLAKDSVLRHTEVGERELLRSNREDCVDARCLLVCVLSRCGLTDMEVSELMGVSRQCVTKLRGSLDMRLRKWSVRTNWQRICNEVATD